MKVIMLSSDARIFENDSAVRARMVRYGEAVTALYILVCAGSGLVGDRATHGALAHNVFAYHFSSRMRVFAYMRALSLGRKLARQARGEGVHCLVTAQDPFELGFISMALAKLSRIPLQIQLHTDVLSPFFRNASLKNWIRVVLARIVLPRAACIRAVSERIAASLLAAGCVRYGTPMDVLPIIVDVPRDFAERAHKTRMRDEPFTIFMAGRLTREKRYDVALAAFERVVKAVPEARLVILGSGPEEERIKARVAQGGYGMQVRIERWSNDAALRFKKIADADVLFLTSDYEGYSMLLVESALLGTPFVATDVGVARALSEGAALPCVAPVRGAEALAQALIRLAHEPEFSTQVANTQRENAERMTLTEEEYFERHQELWWKCGA